MAKDETKGTWKQRLYWKRWLSLLQAGSKQLRFTEHSSESENRNTHLQRMTTIWLAGCLPPLLSFIVSTFHSFIQSFSQSGNNHPRSINLPSSTNPPTHTLDVKLMAAASRHEVLRCRFFLFEHPLLPTPFFPFPFILSRVMLVFEGMDGIYMYVCVYVYICSHVSLLSPKSFCITLELRSPFRLLSFRLTETEMGTTS